MRHLPTISLGLLFSILASVSPTSAHDPHGIMAERDIPQDILDTLDKRSRLRNPNLRARVLPLASASTTKQEQELKQLGLPAKFESALESIFQADAKWDRGQSLTICFFDGSQTARKNVLDVATEIFDLAALRVDAGDLSNIRTCDLLRPSAIRVAFNTDGHYSYIGTDALVIPPALPTLGLENYHQFSTLSEDQKGTVRHEFMHAIGALHEHQHPQAKCNEEFNWPVIFRTLTWPKEKVEFNFKPITELPQFANAELAVTEYDPKSNMHYDLESFLFKDAASATCFIPRNNQLSDADKAMIRRMYVD